MTYNSEVDVSSSTETDSRRVRIKHKFHRISRRVENRLTTQRAEIDQSQSQWLTIINIIIIKCSSVTASTNSVHNCHTGCAFSALTPFGWAAEGIRPAKNESGDVLAWLSVQSECKWFAYGSTNATATPSSLAPVKSRMVYLSGVGLPRMSWKKRPLNGWRVQ